jgi:hypothetical protein
MRQVNARSCASVAALACTALVGVVCSLPAAADGTDLKFKGGIGVIPVSAVTGCPTAPPCVTGSPVTVVQNIVRGVQPPGQIWVINDLDAKVSTNGSIKVKGQGLVLAGGNNAGRAPTPALFVIATLICQPTAPFTQSSTSSAGVMLSPNGDFEINDMLSPAPTFPCASPMLLIQNTANFAWFAVGIFRSGND